MSEGETRYIGEFPNAPEKNAQYYATMGQILIFHAINQTRQQVGQTLMTIEEFSERCAPLLRAVISEEMYVEDIEWSEVKEMTRSRARSVISIYGRDVT